MSEEAETWIAASAASLAIATIYVFALLYTGQEPAAIIVFFFLAASGFFALMAQLALVKDELRRPGR